MENPLHTRTEVTENDLRFLLPLPRPVWGCHFVDVRIENLENDIWEHAQRPEIVGFRDADKKEVKIYESEAYSVPLTILDHAFDHQLYDFYEAVKRRLTLTQAGV